MSLSPPVAAAYFDGRTARRHAVQLDVAAGRWRVRGDFGERTGTLAELTVSEPLGQAPRTLHWPDGAYCEVGDHAGFARLLSAAGHQPPAVVRLQGRLRWALSALVALIVVGALGYLYALPWAAEVVARQVPAALAERLSRQVMDTLDAHVLTPSELPVARQQDIGRALTRLAAAGAPLPAHRLHFRHATELPPNAFALPGGDIVVFDSLVALAADDDEVVAVIAHELGHVAHRHGLRQLLHSTVVSAVAAIYLGDVSSLAAGLGGLVLESRYSRAFEREADRYGAERLNAAGIGADALARMLGKLDGPRPGTAAPDWLATHPDTAARIAALRAPRD